MNPALLLSKVTEGFYRRQWERRPSNGSRTGLVEFDERLELPSREFIEDELADLRATRLELSQVGEMPGGTLEWLDLASLHAHLDLEEQALSEIQQWRTNPVDPVEVALGSIFGLVMRRD